MRYVKLHNDRLQAPLIEDLKVCLVLGAKLRPDDSLSPILQLRVRLVSILANAYPDWTFYISGCRSDTTVIYRTLVEEYHIPEERFVLDFCGYNTFRSVWNMEMHFGQTRYYILTSSFHIARSLRIARWLGYDACGIDISDYEKVKRNPYFWREQLAALRSLWLVFCIRTSLGRLAKWFLWKRLLHRLGEFCRTAALHQLAEEIFRQWHRLIHVFHRTLQYLLVLCVKLLLVASQATD